MPTNDRMSVKEAAEKMGVAQQFIRLGLQGKILPFGYAVKTSSIYTYYISRKLFEKFLETS